MRTLDVCTQNVAPMNSFWIWISSWLEINPPGTQYTCLPFHTTFQDMKWRTSKWFRKWVLPIIVDCAPTSCVEQLCDHGIILVPFTSQSRAIDRATDCLAAHPGQLSNGMSIVIQPWTGTKRPIRHSPHALHSVGCEAQRTSSSTHPPPQPVSGIFCCSINGQIFNIWTNLPYKFYIISSSTSELIANEKYHPYSRKSYQQQPFTRKHAARTQTRQKASVRLSFWSGSYGANAGPTVQVGRGSFNPFHLSILTV